ncbi:MAG: spore germination protein [Oscillospiraceae bacterium]|nr:spore germination protein [Oscillospiraceae bacterium]
MSEAPRPEVRSQHPPETLALTGSLDQNAQTLQELFQGDDGFVLRPIQNRYFEERRYFLAYCAGMMDQHFVSETIIKPLASERLERTGSDTAGTVLRQVLYAHGPGKQAETFADLVEAAAYGDAVVLLPDGSALIFGAQGFPIRGITEPEGEKLLSGPREGFCEALMPNLTLIRRRLRTNDLKLRFMTFGERSRTRACVCYLDSLVNRPVLAELERRLDTIFIDGTLDSHYLAELVSDHPYSPFSSLGSTERPDAVVSKLLEGRVAVLLDGSPVALTLPYLFIENFHAGEDYYLNYLYASFSRMLRILSFCAAALVPGAYIAVTAFHQEILPLPLLINIVREKQSVPFPVGLEVFSLLVIFDILRETGIRMPSGLGQAMSVVGALVLGQAAVAAKLASSMVIVVVALAGVTSLLIPKLSAATLVLRYGILMLSLLLGFPGLMLGLSAALAHILGLRSFGMPQTVLSGNLRAQDMKDIAVRAPLFAMRERGPVSPNRRRSRNAAWRDTK